VSPDFPIEHPLPTNSILRGFANAFVSQLSFDTRTATLSLAYSTYLGGSSNDFDYGNGIAVDSHGNAYVTGIAVSPDFPLAHPLPTNSGLLGGQDAFVSKLSFDARTATLSLAYSTYLGGSSFDFGSGIAVDARGNAYVVGVTDSSDFPLAHSLPTSVSRGSQSAFVAKIRTEPFGDKDRDVDDGHDVRDWEKTGVENGGDR
jgi:Beta-propeller repeat